MVPVPTTKGPSHPTPFKEFLQFFDPDTVSEWLRLGGSALFREMIYQFTQDVVKGLGELEQALTQNNLISFAYTAHGLKGICQHMGARRWAKLMEQMEEECVEQIPSHLSVYLGGLRTEISHLLAVMKTGNL